MKKTLALFSLLAAFAVSAQDALLSPQVVSPDPSPTPLTVDATTGLLFVKVEVNGKPCSMLLDTGASHTIWDKGFIEKTFPDTPPIQLGMHGQTNVQATMTGLMVESLKVGKTEFKQFLGLVVPLAHLKQQTGKDFAGILGMNVMGTAPFRLSYKDRTVTWSQTAPEVTGAKALPAALIPTTNCFNVNVVTDEGKTIPALLDAGASMTIFTPGNWPTEGSSDYQTFNVNQANAAATFGNGKAGTLRLGDLSVKVKPLVRDGMPNLIGADVMKGFDFVVDCKAQKLWAIPHAPQAAEAPAPAAKADAPKADSQEQQQKALAPMKQS